MTPDHALGFEVIDDLLDADAFAGLWGAVQRLRFDLPGPEWHKLWGLGDPMPAASAAFRWSQRPFGLGLDEVAGRIVQAMRASPLFDAQGLDGGDFGFRVVLQPRGARLAAHGDSQHRGTAVFYAHPTWDPRWGGELMIPQVAPPARWPAPGPGDGPLDPRLALQQTAIAGRGVYLLPKPNRLVLLRRGVWHQTQRVDADAGAALRCSITAFASAG